MSSHLKFQFFVEFAHGIASLSLDVKSEKSPETHLATEAHMRRDGLVEQIFTSSDRSLVALLRPC